MTNESLKKLTWNHNWWLLSKYGRSFKYISLEQDFSSVILLQWLSYWSAWKIDLIKHNSPGLTTHVYANVGNFRLSRPSFGHQNLLRWLLNWLVGFLCEPIYDCQTNGHYHSGTQSYWNKLFTLSWLEIKHRLSINNLSNTSFHLFRCVSQLVIESKPIKTSLALPKISRSLPVNFRRFSDATVTLLFKTMTWSYSWNT